MSLRLAKKILRNPRMNHKCSTINRAIQSAQRSPVVFAVKWSFATMNAGLRVFMFVPLSLLAVILLTGCDPASVDKPAPRPIEVVSDGPEPLTAEQFAWLQKWLKEHPGEMPDEIPEMARKLDALSAKLEGKHDHGSDTRLDKAIAELASIRQSMATKADVQAMRPVSQPVRRTPAERSYRLLLMTMPASCAPCRAADAYLKTLANWTYGTGPENHIQIVTDIEVMQSLGVTECPTFVLIRGNMEVGRVVPPENNFDAAVFVGAALKLYAAHFGE